MSLWGPGSQPGQGYGTSVTEWNGTAGTGSLAGGGVPACLVPRRKVQGLDTQLFVLC
jgi:hypothetical protein